MCAIKAKRKFFFEPDYAVPPGETLKEIMEFMQLGQKEFAERLELTEQELIGIFEGEVPISRLIANRLELVTGVSVRFWDNLEAQYREFKSQTKNGIMSPE